MLRFAANLTMMYGEYAFSDRLSAAARDGFTAVEYLFPYEHSPDHLATQLDALDLRLILFNAPPGNWAAGDRGMACIPGKETEFRNSIEKALVFARTLRCPRVHVMAGLQPANVPRHTLLETYRSNLRWSAERAFAAGVVLLIEPINQRDMPGYLLSHQQEAHDIVEQIDSPALKVQMDLYHCQIVEGDVSTRINKYVPGKRVGHIQVASVPDRHEPSGGELDYNYLFDLIDTLDYDGWIGCEYRPKAGTTEGLAWLRERASH